MSQWKNESMNEWMNTKKNVKEQFFYVVLHDGLKDILTDCLFWKWKTLNRKS